VLNMNITDLAALAPSAGSSASTWDTSTVTSARSHGVVASNSALTSTAAGCPSVVTIAEHLARDPAIAEVPAVSTIWRILHKRGFVVPQPHKRPRSAWKRFAAEQPNELWQADVTHWRLTDDTDAFHRFGTPAAQVILGELGIKYLSSRPYHPHACGKVERFHQTWKRRLAAAPPAHTLAELQQLLDAFTTYYNTMRPHRAAGRKTPSPPATRPHRTTGCATTPSTPPAPSPSATTAGYTTSGSASADAAPKSSS
jgi:transposase InsO family protein